MRWLNAQAVLTLGGERGSRDHLFLTLGLRSWASLLPDPSGLLPRWLLVMQAGAWGRGGEWEGALSHPQV